MNRPVTPDEYRDQAERAYQEGDLDGARDACSQAIAGRSDFDRAWYLLGVIRARLADHAGAIAALSEALRIRPEFGDAERALAAIYLARKEHESAAGHYLRAIELGIADPVTQHEYAGVLEILERIDEAIAVRRALQAIHPDLEENNFNLASLTGEEPPARTPSSMTRATFDGYGDHFEEHLVEGLGYRGPDQLFEALTACGVGTDLRILDLGCGTGLCGARFKPLARRLVGVDLSEGMVAQARAKDIYDELHVADVFDYLAGPGEFDLVLAADVFVYIGDLGPVCAAVARLLSDEGLFAFTIEGGAEEGYRIVHEHRISHSPSYIEGLCRDHPFELARLDTCLLRRECGEDIPGAVVVMKKAGEN